MTLRDEMPVLLSVREARAWHAMGYPLSVPMRLLVPHEPRVTMNHGQTLERLRERGGLAPCEIVAILENRKCMAMSLENSALWILGALERDGLATCDAPVSWASTCPHGRGGGCDA